MQTSERLCACGCGEPAPIAKLTNTRCGYKAGEPVRFRVGHYQRTRVPQRGYRGRCPDAEGRVVQGHVAIASLAIGKSLPRGSQVHHVDGNKLNNARGNLVICQDYAYHALLHQRGAVVAVGGNPNTQRFCRACGQAKDFDQFHISRSHQAHGRANKCKQCSKAYNATAYRQRKEESVSAY
jgi:hypothetical protein